MKYILNAAPFPGRVNIKWKHTIQQSISLSLTQTPGSHEAPYRMNSSWMRLRNSLQLNVVFIVSRRHVHKPNRFSSHSHIQDVLTNQGLH